jgi:homoserine O-succinyltransferase
MPIKIPENLPAIDVLRREGVMVMGESSALRQDIRPLRIALLNLMPNKERTETQFARLVGATPLQIDLTLVRMTEHRARNTAVEHLEAFYITAAEAMERRFDGLIVTGAPIERLPFEEVAYWDELRAVFDWSQTHARSTFAICWGAQAMLHHFHGTPKHALERKAFGCFRHRNVSPGSPYLRGVSDDIMVPVSRWTEVRESDLPPSVPMLLTSGETGPCLLEDPAHRALYMFNHFEYDTTSLDEEYRRDLSTGERIGIPVNYYPGDDPSRPPENRWRSHAHLIFGNWLNEVYQETPFDWV